MTTATIGVTEAAVAIPEIWANSAIKVLRDNIALASRVYSDTDVASFTRGDVLHVPYPGTMASNAKSAGTAYALSQPANAADVQVTLSSHRAVSFIVEDIARAQSNLDLIDNYSRAAAITLAQDIESALFTEAVGTATTCGAYGTDITLAGLLGAWKAMTDAKCPSGDRFIALSTKDIVKLVSDSGVANLLAFSRGGQIASDPQNLGAIAGFDGVLASQLVPTVAGTPLQTKNIAWRRDGLILAMRGLPEPPAGSGATAANVRDADSGLVMRAVTAYDATYGGIRVTLEVLYGVQTLDEAKVCLVKS